MSDTEKRLERLESVCAQQESTIEQLSDVVFTQQRALDELEKKLAILALKYRELAAMQSDDGPADVPPPHYGR